MKNPFDSMSPRSIRIIYSLCATLILAACFVNFYHHIFIRITGNDQCRWTDKGTSRMLITEIVSGGVTESAGVKNGDYLLKINDTEFKTSQDAQLYINKLAGTVVRYTIERDGKQFDTNVLILKSVNMAYLAQFFYGLGFLLMGMVVVLVRPQGTVQRMFARYGLWSMLFFGMSATDFGVNDPTWKLVNFRVAFSVVTIFGLPMFVRYFCFFPVRKKILDRRWFTVALYAVAVLLYVGLLLAPRIPFLVKLNAPIFYSRYAFYLGGLAVFVHSYARLVQPQRRKELRPILLGVAIGILTFCYVIAVSVINPFAAFLNPTLLLPAFLIIIVPIMFGYAIVRYRLMDIDLIIKRSLIYTTVTASVAAIYILTVYGLGSFMTYVLGVEENQALIIFALVIIAFAFDPLKRRMQEGIDRVFYQERYNYQRALLEFTRELPGKINLEEILNSIIHRISDTMHIEKVSVVLCDETEGCFSVSQNIEQDCCSFGEVEMGLLSVLRGSKRPQSFAILAYEPDAINLNPVDKDKLIRSGVVLSIPMFLKDRLVGLINVGPKLSGKVYSQEDIDLLSTVGGQAAIAIENSRLHKSEIEKEKIKEELSLALRIQKGLLPKGNPTIPGLEVSGISLPALTVGGDYYDFIEMSPTKLLVVVADVSGKGMSAALYMSKIQGMVQLAAHMYDSPKEMLIHVNRRIYDGIERKSFITMILALFDMTKREVRICRAGHNKALIGTNGSLKYLEGAGIGLGLERGPVFESNLEEIVQPLKAESIFLFYTDGLTEAMNERGTQFGEETVTELVKRKRLLTASELQHSIVSAVEEFRGSAEQHDDLTMVIVKAGELGR
ncbi:MAG: SpoIIE family protein phosphatase [Bacteroidota bacterium]